MQKLIVYIDDDAFNKKGIPNDRLPGLKLLYFFKGR